MFQKVFKLKGLVPLQVVNINFYGILGETTLNNDRWNSSLKVNSEIK